MKDYQVEVNWRTPVQVNWLKSESGLSDGEFRDRFGFGQTEIDLAMDGRETLSLARLREVAGYFGLTLGQVCGSEAI